eukprot:1191541-Prorocentrum_minimum.AAC.5
MLAWHLQPKQKGDPSKRVERGSGGVQEGGSGGGVESLRPSLRSPVLVPVLPGHTHTSRTSRRASRFTHMSHTMRVPLGYLVFLLASHPCAAHCFSASLCCAAVAASASAIPGCPSSHRACSSRREGEVCAKAAIFLRSSRLRRQPRHTQLPRQLPRGETKKKK